MVCLLYSDFFGTGVAKFNPGLAANQEQSSQRVINDPSDFNDLVQTPNDPCFESRR